MLLTETLLLSLSRFSLFFACRKYLLQSLYSDLQSLSADSTPGGGESTPTHQRNEIELDSLPPPTTHTPKSSKFFNAGTTFLHSTVSRVIFSWLFAESCTMFFLLMLQGLDILSPRTRLLNWRFSLFFLMATILVIIPLSVSLLLALGAGGGDSRSCFKSLLGPRVVFSLVPVVLYLFALSYIPLPEALSSSDIMTAALSRLIVLGTIILGLLSGFGAISSSWQYLPFLSRAQSVPGNQDVDASEYALASIRNDLRTRRAEAERRAESKVEGSWFSRVGTSFRGGDSLTQELLGLEALEYQMSRKTESLRQRRDAAKYSKTFRGKVFNVAAHIFAVYCVVRFISSLYNITFLPTRRSSSTTTYPDLITDLLAHILSSEIKLEDVASLSRQISLALVGVIILTSIRLVLRGVTRALRVTSRNLGASLMLLVLAQLMGIYLLSTVVQMRSSFPPPPTKPDADLAVKNLFSTIPEYEVFGSLFDWSFLASFVASAFVRWGAERVNGDDDS
ncbi:hypothetical protein K443DRAFT_96034 [Laccaria amethystina LaAM-08-1]|uniref:Golgi pH regulator n=1 Tax=Laccaria amethystina LaAM-08-1 TaxID=1095629 RepID=A0A0C9XDD3_9AGAR|nr:hypothetical protein K443DRAFT_96034 [Laccaria amethystina LaAM-08-1]